MLDVNPDTFRQVLDNLFRNGFHYNSSADPAVWVYEEDGAIVVEDNGDGFDDTEFDKLTRPFQRGASAKSGSGLGLAITRAIIEGHGYRFSARSTPGHGSKFYIHFRW